MDVIREAGVVLLLYEADFPSLPTGCHSRAENVRTRLCRAAMAVRDKTLSAIQKEYEEDPHPRKRFFFSPYRLDISATYEEGVLFLRLLCRVRLLRNGKTVGAREKILYLEKKSGYLCPYFYYRAKEKKELTR